MKHKKKSNKERPVLKKYFFGGDTRNQAGSEKPTYMFQDAGGNQANVDPSGIYSDGETGETYGLNEEKKSSGPSFGAVMGVVQTVKGGADTYLKPVREKNEAQAG